MNEHEVCVETTATAVPLTPLLASDFCCTVLCSQVPKSRLLKRFFLPLDVAVSADSQVFGTCFVVVVVVVIIANVIVRTPRCFSHQNTTGLFLCFFYVMRTYGACTFLHASLGVKMASDGFSVPLVENFD